MLVIRLRRMGSAKKPFFRVVVTEARTARESSFVENVGMWTGPVSVTDPSDSNKQIATGFMEYYLMGGGGSTATRGGDDSLPRDPKRGMVSPQS